MRATKFTTAADLRADPSPLLHNPSYFINRLEAAEAVCLLYGWSPSTRNAGFRERASFALWSKWLDLVGGHAFARPKLHPHLSDTALRPIVENDEALQQRAREKIPEIVVEVAP